VQSVLGATAEARKQHNHQLAEQMTELSRWLDGQTNTPKAANENLAREFMELFTFGHGDGYTEEDVRAGARALSGWVVKATGQTSTSRTVGTDPTPSVGAGRKALGFIRLSRSGDDDAGGARIEEWRMTPAGDVLIATGTSW
jgi:uncharacterized protein DUF1800